MTLDSVISNEELDRRPSRPEDRDAERGALEFLAQELWGSPRRVLQSLSDAAMRLCRAHSAGISLVEEQDGREVFRWHAVSGRFATYLWTTMPRDSSPCGTVLDREGPQLMILPERYFAPLLQMSPRIFEALLIPFSVGNVVAGTVWILAHDETRRFDSEDRRVVTSLAKFAALAYAGLSTRSIEDVLHMARLHKRSSLPPDAPPRSIQRRVLIVDADRAASETLAAFLRSMGHLVQVASGGRSGLAVCLKMRPHVVLVDTKLTDVSAYELPAQMRKLLASDVRIVALTAYRSGEEQRRWLDAGFDEHLVKPLDADAVQRVLV